MLAAAGGATAQRLIDGSDVRNNSLTGADIRNRSLTPADFRGSIRGVVGIARASGAIGPTGPQGRVGPVGTAGPQGPAGPQGSKGDNGNTGPAGSTVTVRASYGPAGGIDIADDPAFTVVDELNLVAGTWMVTASLTVTSDGNDIVICELRPEGAGDPIGEAQPVAGTDDGGAATIMGPVTLAAPTDIQLRCTDSGTGPTVTAGIAPVMQAVRADTIQIDP